ncbi:MAG: BCD family MFS transporter [Steroidobacteraceae bacterium]
MNRSATQGLGWLAIFRLGLVQAAIGGIVVLATSTMNRVMVVELAMPAVLPGFLVALHYIVQVLRPRLGYSSDVGGRRTPWIVGGMALLGVATSVAAVGIQWMEHTPLLGIALAVVAFLFIGIGVGMVGTALLVLMATHIDERRRAAGATLTWIMMIAGFVVTSVIAGKALEPFSTARLVDVTAGISIGAVLLTWLAVLGIEGRGHGVHAPEVDDARAPFRAALRQVWQEGHSRRLALFIFVAMVAYSAQDLILEPFAGLIFGMTPAQSTKLSGVQNSGVLLGMLVIAIACTRANQSAASLRAWTIGGCVASGMSLLTLAVAGFVGVGWPIQASVFVLGLSNGVFAVGAVGSMMNMVGTGRRSREGVRMGLWGAAQALAFALGGLGATLLVDISRWAFGSIPLAYGLVFVVEAAMFLIASRLAASVRIRDEDTATDTLAAAAAGR